jgi:hypothetical protein
MDAKLDSEVDVEGAVDMMDRGEECRQVGALACALIQPTAHEPRIGGNGPVCGHFHAVCTRSSFNRFPVCTFKAVRKSRPVAAQRHIKT